MRMVPQPETMPIHGVPVQMPTSTPTMTPSTRETMTTRTIPPISSVRLRLSGSTSSMVPWRLASTVVLPVVSSDPVVAAVCRRVLAAPGRAVPFVHERPTLAAAYAWLVVVHLPGERVLITTLQKFPFDTEKIAGGFEFGLPDLGHPLFDPRLIHPRVEDVSLLATGGTDQDDTNPLGRVTGHRPGALRGFVVRMRVDRQQRPSLGLHHR